MCLILSTLLFPQKCTDLKILGNAKEMGKMLSMFKWWDNTPIYEVNVQLLNTFLRTLNFLVLSINFQDLFIRYYWWQPDILLREKDSTFWISSQQKLLYITSILSLKLSDMTQNPSSFNLKMNWTFIIIILLVYAMSKQKLNLLKTSLMELFFLYRILFIRIPLRCFKILRW